MSSSPQAWNATERPGWPRGADSRTMPALPSTLPCNRARHRSTICRPTEHAMTPHAPAHPHPSNVTGAAPPIGARARQAESPSATMAFLR
jgi:hypothetical protein